MKVLMTYHGLMDPDSGACGSMVRIGEKMKSMGVDLSYWTYSDMMFGGSTVSRHLRFPFSVAMRSKRRPSPDIIDACTGDSWVLGERKGSHRIPVVIRSSGLEHQMFGDRRKPGESWRFTLYWRWFVLWSVGLAIKKADHYIALTQGEANYVGEHFQVAPEKISVMRHVLPEHFEQVGERVLPFIFSILWVALWDKRKGYDLLIEALDSIVHAGGQFSLTLAGVRCAEHTVRGEIPAAWQDRVTIIPFLPNSELPAHYMSHHVFVFPSRFEGYGKALVEAMACGCPPIATNVGAARGLLKDHENGMVLKDGTASELREALQTAMNHREWTESLGIQARYDTKPLLDGDVYRQRLQLYQGLARSEGSSIL
jgi:glycosyltransferase involved in cell wall biosynthesis